MSIQSEITRISGNVSDALTAIGAKGVTVPYGANSDDLADLIGAIQTGGGESYSWETKSNQGITIVADDPNYFIWTYTEPLQANETFRITWGENGTEYICQTVEDPTGTTYDGYYLGNASIVNLGDDTGEPFLLYRNSSTRMVGATDQAAGSWRIKVEKRVSSSESGMNVQAYMGMDYVTATSYTATDVTLTVKKTGTYTVSWMGFRNTTSGTNGSQLYVNGTATGSEQTTFTRSYGQNPILTGIELNEGDVLVIRAISRSTSYYMYVGNLVIEQTA